MSALASEVKLDIDYWAKRWVESRTGWHLNTVNPTLIKYLETLTGSPENRDKDSLEENSKKKIFVPLCGKTRDVAYLMSLGYQVFSVEGVAQPIEELSQESNFGLKLDEKESIYSTPDGKLKIYLGDLFKCPIEKWGPFDFLWDRGSLIAMEYSNRAEYIKMMQRSLRNANGDYVPFRYLLETVEYDRTKFPGPPHAVDENDINELYSSWGDIQRLEKFPLPETHSLRKVPDMGPNCDQSMYLIAMKK